MQHSATLLDATFCARLATLLRHVGCCWLNFDHFQTWANNTQPVATRWSNARNMLRRTLLRYFALACCDRLVGASGVICMVWVHTKAMETLQSWRKTQGKSSDSTEEAGLGWTQGNTRIQSRSQAFYLDGDGFHLNVKKSLVLNRLC